MSPLPANKPLDSGAPIAPAIRPPSEQHQVDTPYAAYLPGIRARHRAVQAEREAMRLRACCASDSALPV